VVVVGGFVVGTEIWWAGELDFVDQLLPMGLLSLTVKLCWSSPLCSVDRVCVVV
jgi:hypothetical protein